MTPIIVLHLYDGNHIKSDHNTRSQEDALQEAVTLCKAIDLVVSHADIIKLRAIKAGQIFSDDRLSMLQDLITLHQPELIMINWNVTPIQQRNLEKILKVKILDRIGLILEIFGRRASTKEGKLQVELASMQYQKSRLVKAWSHLERQRGGGGFTGGPGETQKEADRRMIDEKIFKIEKALKEVVQTRNLHRSARTKIPYPVVALAGYTNAGKSTLFNKLTQADVLEADMLFATLDPTLRAVKLPSGDKIILSDTVGFISNLPTQLVKAFRATLEEVTQAALVLHIRDVSSLDTHIQCHDVLKVLKNLSCDSQQPILEVFNKIDVADNDTLASARTDAILRNQDFVECSARTGENLSELLSKIDAFLGQNKKNYAVECTSSHGEFIAALHRDTDIISAVYNDDKTRVHIVFSTDERRIGQLKKNYPDQNFIQEEQSSIDPNMI